MKWTRVRTHTVQYALFEPAKVKLYSLPSASQISMSLVDSKLDSNAVLTNKLGKVNSSQACSDKDDLGRSTGADWLTLAGKDRQRRHSESDVVTTLESSSDYPVRGESL